MTGDWPREVPYQARRHPDGARERMRRGIAAARAAIGPRPEDAKPPAGAPPLAVTLDELAHVDPEAALRFDRTIRAVLAGGEVPCHVCPLAFPDAGSWRAHARTEHP